MARVDGRDDIYRDEGISGTEGRDGGLGWIMGSNVWAIIWKNNKKIIDGTLSGTPPANAATLARQAFLASRMNLYLSVPMLFFMAAGFTHKSMFGL